MLIEDAGDVLEWLAIIQEPYLITPPFLTDMEPTLRPPSFRTFVKRIPTAKPDKPLPPRPDFSRRSSSSSPPRPRRSSSFWVTRRSSSCYSCTASQWFSDDGSDSTDESLSPMPTLPLLSPVAFSASTPHLTRERSISSGVEPRKCSPLIMTPSPTESRATSVSRRLSNVGSIGAPSEARPLAAAEEGVRNIPLEDARAAANAPGAVHLLPEELRARVSRKSKSLDNARADYIPRGAEQTPHELPRPSMLVDVQGRRRSIVRQHKQSVCEAAHSATLPDVKHPSMTLNGVPNASEDRGTARSPLALQSRQASHENFAQLLGIGDNDEPRGRSKHRRSRTLDHRHYTLHVEDVPQTLRAVPGLNALQPSKDRHTPLAEQYRQLIGLPANCDVSGVDVKMVMKMLPQPLFYDKPRIHLEGLVNDSMSAHRSVMSSRHDVDCDDDVDASRYRQPSDVTVTEIPEVGTLEQIISHRQPISSSGSIPISPPSPHLPIPPLVPQTCESASAGVSVNAAANAHRNADVRVSAFYPYVARRKRSTGKAQQSSKLHISRSVPPVPPLSLSRSLMGSMLTSRPIETSHQSQSIDGEISLYQRLTKGAMRYADLLTKPPGLADRDRHTRAKTTPADVTHEAVRCPVRMSPKRPRLDGTTSSKRSFELRRLSLSLPTWPSLKRKAPAIIHHVGHPRSLDGRKDSFKEAALDEESKASNFAGFLAAWREDKSGRRREELKKIIKVVPQEDGEAVTSSASD